MVKLVPFTVMPVVTGVQVIGGSRLDVKFNTRFPAFVGQDRVMFGGLATTFKMGTVATIAPGTRTPAASACDPLADGATVTTVPFAVLALVTL